MQSMPPTLSRWMRPGFLAAALSGALLCAGCTPYILSRTTARNATLREGTLEVWLPRRIGEQDAGQFLLDRTALILQGSDHAELESIAENSFNVIPMRDGRPLVRCNVGAAVALTEDGYFLTAAHCVDETPYVVMLRDSSGFLVQALGRTVWDGFGGTPPVDLALFHAPAMRSVPLEWRALCEISPGMEVLCAGSVSPNRLAGGRIQAGPATQEEAAAGSAHVFHVTVPLVPGDSGGPAILLDGRLLGISTGVDVTHFILFRGTSHGVVQRPDPAYLHALIEADRAREAGGGSE